MSLNSFCRHIPPPVQLMQICINAYQEGLASLGSTGEKHTLVMQEANARLASERSNGLPLQPSLLTQVSHVPFLHCRWKCYNVELRVHMSSPKRSTVASDILVFQNLA